MKRILPTALLVIVSAACFAHRDTVLKVQVDGRIDGLPAEYNPASLSVNFSNAVESDSPPISSLTLTLGGKRVVVPECVTGLALTGNMKDVQVVGSWYHDTSTMIPYIVISLYDPGHDEARYRPGFKLMFDLSTAKLVEMDVVILRGASGAQHVPVDLAARCQSVEMRKFSQPRLRPNTSFERTREG